LVTGPVLHSAGSWMGAGPNVCWGRESETGEDENIFISDKRDGKNLW